VKKYLFDQFTATRSYNSPAYSPDGKRIAYVDNTTGQYNLWTIPSGGGFPTQLTAFTDNTLRGLSWSPDGEQILFLADQNGDEMNQVYLIGTRGGWPEALTNAMQAQHAMSGSAWSPDGRQTAYCANDVVPTDVQIILRDMHTGETRRPIEISGTLYSMEWSPNGRMLTVVNITSNTNQDILVLDLQSGEVTNATPHEGNTVFFPGPWARDNSGFYIITNQGREYNGLAFYDLAKKRWDWVETPEQDIEQLSLSHDGRALVWAVNQDGASKLAGRDLQTGAALKLPGLPLGVINSMDIAPDGNRLVMVLVRPKEAANLYEVDLTSGAMKALGQSMIGGIAMDDLVEPELVRFPTFDGRMIPAWLYRPQGTERFPVVLSIHGGPEAQERPAYNYNGLYQYLLDRGFGVLAPNIRGSTGYGISYQKLIHRDFGGDELKDIEHAAKYLRSLDWVDSKRIAVMGGSFGGFATLSAISRLPEYWALGVDLVGPSNLVTFARAVPPFWKRFMKEWVGDPDEDYDFLMERSPITYVDQIRVPLLVIQHTNYKNAPGRYC